MGKMTMTTTMTKPFHRNSQDMCDDFAIVCRHFYQMQEH